MLRCEYSKWSVAIVKIPNAETLHFEYSHLSISYHIERTSMKVVCLFSVMLSSVHLQYVFSIYLFEWQSQQQKLLKFMRPLSSQLVVLSLGRRACTVVRWRCMNDVRIKYLWRVVDYELDYRGRAWRFSRRSSALLNDIVGGRFWYFTILRLFCVDCTQRSTFRTPGAFSTSYLETIVWPRKDLPQ